jgi:hypothetical protein
MLRGKSAYKLIEQIESLKSTGFKRQYTLKGVGNLSFNDLQKLELYAKVYIRNAGHGFCGMNYPSGNIKVVLDKYNMRELEEVKFSM